MPALVLGAICIVVAIMLAGVNMLTGPIIADRLNAAADEALLEVLPDGKNFKEIDDLTGYPESVTKGYKADGGYVFQVVVTGKSAGLTVMCGISSDGKVVGTKVLANEETPSYAENVFPNVEGTNGKYTGMTLDAFEPYLVSGATLTSKAYGEAVKAALQAAAIAGGASVDTRTPEQKLQDGCNEALGTTGLEYKRWFMSDELVGIDRVYTNKDTAGYVFVIGDAYVGVNASGVVGTASAENAAKATAAYSVISSSTQTSIILPTGVNTDIVKKAYVTSYGNYVFEVEGEGYAALYGNYIKIKVSISAEGAIIDCVTTRHRESENIGDKCETDEYRDNWIGVTDDDVKVTVDIYVTDPDTLGEQLIPPGCTDVGVITGATYTTYGYQTAIKAAFTAFELITEGGND